MEDEVVGGLGYQTIEHSAEENFEEELEDLLEVPDKDNHGLSKIISIIMCAVCKDC